MHTQTTQQQAPATGAAALPVAQQRDDYGPYGMKCTLCGGTTTAFVCERCSRGLQRTGGKL